MFDPSKLDLSLDSEKPQEKAKLETEKTSLETQSTVEINSPEVEENTQNTSRINKEDPQVSEQKQTIVEEKPEPKAEEQILFDINISSVSDILNILIKNGYDFATIEPKSNLVEIIFRKDKAIKETRNIKFPTYSEIIIKAKSISKLDVAVTNETQEGSSEIDLNQKKYKILTKVVPSPLGEKVFLKCKETQKTVSKKTNKKTSIGQILGFLGAIIFMALIIGGAFIGFVVMNAQTVDDVKFFTSLGINLDEINRFIGLAVGVIFSILVLLETIFLAIYLFKFALTKKIFKQKKIRYGIISTFFLIITFITASTWMFIQQKVNALPDWQNKARGEIQLYDNTLLQSEEFDIGNSIISDTRELIGPVEIKFDLNVLTDNENKKGLTIRKYIWDYGDGETFETTSPTAIKRYDKKGTYDISLKLETIDFAGEQVERIVENIPSINITNVVEVTEKSVGGGTLVKLDASDLSELGKVEWYDFENTETPILTDYILQIQKPLKEKIYGMYIKRNDRESNTFDKFFILRPTEDTSLSGEIKFEKQIDNELEYELRVENTKNDFGDGFIEEFKWIIGEKEITKEGNINNPSGSSKILFTFDKYGDNNVKVILKNSSGEEKELQAIINIPRSIKLRSPIVITDNGEEIEDIEYNEKTNDYYINSVAIPTTLSLDARRVRAEDQKYTLEELKWDTNGDGDFDKKGTSINHEIEVEGNNTINVEFTFKHRIKDDDIIKLSQKIHIEGVKKDAILKIEIDKDRDYTPVVVKFDASKSQVKNENIEKFVWDFGDGETEVGDAIVGGHKYVNPGDYEIVLKVITESGKEYKTTKNLILKPTPQNAEIKTSFKRAPVNQTIDFSSNNSTGQINSYFWKFGDGETSTLPNPSHSYDKPGKYSVELILEYSNRNILEDKVDIEIY